MFNLQKNVNGLNDLNDSMRDYYKILGVKETASEEEIRERWVEWMRKLHPDHIGEKGKEGRRVKEINEAYEVLKYSSSRAQYDLRRVYERRRKIVSFRRAVFRKSYLLLLPVLLGLVYLSLHESAPPSAPKQVDKPAADSTGKSNSLPPEEENLRFKGRQAFQKPSLFVGTGEASPQETEKRSRKEKAKVAPVNVSVETPGNIAMGDPRETLRGIEEHHSLSSSSQASPGQAKDGRDERRGGVTQLPADEKRVSKIPQKEKEGASNQKPGDSDAPRLMDNRVAGEDEVERFFEDYLRCYTQRDIDGFLGFFSRRAIQNRKENIDEIRRIYSQFFNHSESLLYHLKNPKIDIFPNNAQVRASYEIRQVLQTGDTRLWKGNVEWTLMREDGKLKIFSLLYQHDRSP
jgi:curved DNA-binding protein CbpA